MEIGIPFKALDALTADIWDRVLETNLRGPYLLARACAPHLRAQGAGRIVNIASVGGLYPGSSSIAYSASKAGLIHLSRCLAVALAPEVTVNCIAPGLVEGTRMAQRLPPEIAQWSRTQAVLGRTASAQDIAEQAVTFCRAESVTGQVLSSTGGCRPGCTERSPDATILRMGERSDARAINDYWGRDGLERAILSALAAAGKDVDALTIDDLALSDQFHSGGKDATMRLAHLAGLRPGLRVLDVGGGLGGPARTLAADFGCHVTVVDLTESYVRAGAALTARLGLSDRVTHRTGDALALVVGADPFDIVWTQNSGMNVPEKELLYAGLPVCSVKVGGSRCRNRWRVPCSHQFS